MVTTAAVESVLFSQTSTAASADIRPVTAVAPVGNVSSSEQSNAKASDSGNSARDQYVPANSDSPENAPGLYRVELDENGNQRVLFDRAAPQRSASQDSVQSDKSQKSSQDEDGELAQMDKEQSDDTQKAEEKTEDSDKAQKKSAESKKTNTQRVEAEIKSLKQRKVRLQQQLKDTTNVERRKELQIQLSQIEEELQLKDTDSYREKHAS